MSDLIGNEGRQKRTMRTGELTEAVLRHYSVTEGDTKGKYVSLTQVRAATGFEDPSTADVMVMGNWPSSGAELMGFEVKISRSDWLNEVKAPTKCLPTKKYCNRWWLVIADEAFVKEGELPADWGMMVPKTGGGLRIVKAAPKLSPEPLTHLFVASLLRSNQKGTIPLDVHSDHLKDARRDIEAALRIEYEGLLQYFRDLKDALGITMKHGYSTGWTAQIQGNYRSFSSEELVALIRSAMSSDLDHLKQDMEQLRREAQQIVETADKALMLDKAA
jgi:hypothetical protein